MPEKAEKRTRRSIVRIWLGQEAFWRDVTTRTLAAAIVALGAYLYALGAGYVSSPTGSQTLRGIWNVVLIPTLGILIGSSMIWAPIVFNPTRYAQRPRWVQRMAKVALYVLAVFTGLSLFQVMSGFFNDIPWAWPFNTPIYHIPLSNDPR